MAASLAQAVAHLASQARPTGRRIGTIQAIDTTTGTLTVTMGGTPVEGIPWQASSYSPVEGDQVTILWDQSAGMLVTGTISTVRVAEPDPVDVVLTRQAGWSKRNYWFDEGSGDPSTPQPNWRAMDVAEVMDQGRWQLSLTVEGRDHPAVYEAASGIYWGDPAAAIPAGGRFERMAIRARALILGQYGDHDGGPPRSPRIFGHNFTGLPPGSIGEPPTVNPEFGPWEPAPLNHGEVVTIPIRNDWAQALLDGTIAGFTFWADQETQKLRLTAPDDVNAAPELLVTYTPPAE